MSDQVGSIYYESSISTKQLKKDSAEADAIAKRTGDNLGVEMERGESRASAALSKLAAVAKVTAIATGVALVGGLTAAAKASFEQVGAVQQATVGLRAYEKDASKVDDVLKSLVSYARSDMGVLFNRKDLFQSAQMLKLNGVETENLTDNVKILSRSVGLGLGNWQDLNSVVGRVVSTGRLSGIEFDQLTQYGYKLDKSLRNTNISATDLFKALDKGIPVDAMAGQANTIQGIGIRLQTAFRGIGDAILGVDSDTGEFIENGLGDKLINGLGTATTALKNFKPFMTELGNGIVGLIDIGTRFATKLAEIAMNVWEKLKPSLSELWTTIRDELIPTMQTWWKDTLEPIATWLAVTAVDAAKKAIEALDGLLKFISDNQWVLNALLASFVAIKAGLLISDAVKGFQAGMALVQASSATTAAVINSTVVGSIAGIGAAAAGATVMVGGLSAALAGLNAKGAIDGKKKEIISSLEQTRRIAEAAGNKKVVSDIDSKIAQARGLYKGGPVSANKPYFVGENPDGSLNKTSELFVPRSAGKIVNSDQLQEAMGKGGSSNVTNISLNLTGIMSRSRSDQREIAKDLVRSINEELVSQGKPAIGGIQ
jgi:hypothetical protein